MTNGLYCVDHDFKHWIWKPSNEFRVAFESDFVAEIRKEEIAVCQDEANQQHYEVQIFWDPEERLKKAMITK